MKNEPKYIIFLDWDGVMNCNRSETSYHFPRNYNNGKNYDYDCMGNLRELISYAFSDMCRKDNLINFNDVKIVVHSSWRKYPIASEYFNFADIDNGKVAIKNPMMDILRLLLKMDYSVEILPYTTGNTKGDDIKKYLEVHGFRGNYVILDDDYKFQKFPELFPDNYVRTNMETGFDEAALEKAIEVLYGRTEYTIIS